MRQRRDAVRGGGQVENNIKSLRKERGLSQQVLADMVGVHKNTIINWETEATDPRSCDLVKLSETLGCTIEDIVLASEHKAG